MEMAGRAQQPTSSPSLVAQNMAPPPMQQGLGAMVPGAMGQAPQGMPPQQRAPTPQPTMQAASGGLAGMYTPEEDFAEGGIVAFQSGGLNSGEGMEANAVTDDAFARFLAENEGAGGGNAGLQARAFDDSQETRQMIKNLTRGTTTPAEDDAAISRYMQQIERYGGPDIYKSAIGRLDKRESSRSKSSSQGQGLALLAAAGAILEGNTLARGAAKAFPVFAKEMGEVQRADIAEQRSIESMRFALADAQRKERMGDIRGAQAARETARKEKADAATFELNKVNALATLDAKALQATREANKGAGGLKYQEQILQNNVDYFKSTLKPKQGETPEAFDARVRKMASDETARALKTSFSTGEIGGLNAATRLAPVQATVDTRVNEGLTKFKEISASGAPYRRALRAGNTEEANRILKTEEARLREVFKGSEAATGGAPTPAPAPTPAKPAASKPTTATKVVSMADVDATVASSGKTRQEVMDALKAKGYTVK